MRTASQVLMIFTPRAGLLLCCSGSIDGLTVHLGEKKPKTNETNKNQIDIAWSTLKKKKPNKMWQVSTPVQTICTLVLSYRCSVMFVTATVTWHFIFSLVEEMKPNSLCTYTHRVHLTRTLLCGLHFTFI